MGMIRFALEYYYGCYNNLKNALDEHHGEVLKAENKISWLNRISFWSWMIGTSLILTYIYINL